MKTAVVTGANRGLGLGFVEVLAAKGYKVYAAMRNPDDFQASSESVVAVKLDVTNDPAIEAFVSMLSENGETVSLLVNNAGLNKDTAASSKDLVCRLDRLDRRALNRMFDVNATSPLMLAKNIVPLMGKGGLILNISSNRGSFNDEGKNSSANYGYRASKAALNMFTRALSEDLPEGICTVAVHPGGVKTGMNPVGPSEPADAAREIIESFVESWKPAMNGGFYYKDGSRYAY